jgi:hypothetical protein
MPDGLSPHINKKLAGTDSGVVCRLGAYSIRTNGDAPTYVRVYTLPGTRRNKMTSALQQTRQRQAHLDEQQLGGIRAALRGQVCLEGSPGYDEARRSGMQ